MRICIDVTFTKRFQCALECYDGAEVEQPEIPVKVALYIDNLNGQRFRFLKLKLKNDFHQNGIVFPESLNDAFS